MQVIATNGKEEKELTLIQRKAIVALMTEPNTRAAAKKVGCGERTIYTWLDMPEFKTALAEAEAMAIDALSRELIGLARRATAAIRAVFDDPKASHNQKLRAAQLVIENLLRIRELSTVEKELTELERLAQ